MFEAQSSKGISTESTRKNSGANRSTIGGTTISTEHVDIIREEVCSTMRKVSPGINVSTSQPVFPNMGTGKLEIGKPSASTIDLIGPSQ